MNVNAADLSRPGAQFRQSNGFRRAARAAVAGVTFRSAMRWWPPVSVLAMVVLGCAVGTGSTPVDDWFSSCVHHVIGTSANRLLVITDWSLLGPVLACCVAAAAYRRRWRLAAVALISPLAATVLTEVLKRLFDRRKDGALAYPSGHMTLVVVVTGIVLIVAGSRGWAVGAAVAANLLAAVALGATFHYFTDTIGAVLLGSAMVCVALAAAGLMPAKRAPPPGDAMSTARGATSDAPDAASLRTGRKSLPEIAPRPAGSADNTG